MYKPDVPLRRLLANRKICIIIGALQGYATEK